MLAPDHDQKSAVRSVVYYGYNLFADCLAYMINNRFDVRAFITDKPSFYNDEVIDLARSAGLRIFTSEEDYRESDVAILKTDLVFSAAYSRKILNYDCASFAINVHPTLLPDGRGPNPLHRFFRDAADICGVTFHKITDVFDAGDIIMSRRIPVSINDTRETVAFRLRFEAGRMMPDLFSSFQQLWDEASPQGRSSYYRRATDRERHIDFGQDSHEIRNLIRAWAGVGVFFDLDAKRWLAHNAVSVELSHGQRAGSVFERNAQRLVIASRDGVVVFRTSEVMVVADA